MHALSGIRVVVCSLMINTVFTMAKKGIVDKIGGIIFVSAFVLACFTPIPTAVLVVTAGILGVTVKKCKGGKC